MAYDEDLARRIRKALGKQAGLSEKKMFGGVGFMIHGNMACGVHKDRLMVRVGREAEGEALAQPHVAPFDITGRPMQGWVLVAPEGLRTDKALSKWVKWGATVAQSLPPK